MDYFLPYHQFVDKLVRYGLSLEKVNENVIRLSEYGFTSHQHVAFTPMPLFFSLQSDRYSFLFHPGCLIAIEGLPLHFVLFCKLWWEIYNKSHEVMCSRPIDGDADDGEMK